jgi:hypothetical protein
MTEEQYEKAIDAAARRLWDEGRFFCWYPDSIREKTYEEFCQDDPIGQSEFEGMAQRVVEVVLEIVD